MAVAADEGGRDAEPDLPGSGAVAHGVASGPRSCASEVGSHRVVLRGSRPGAVKLYFSMQRSVIAVPGLGAEPVDGERWPTRASRAPDGPVEAPTVPLRWTRPAWPPSLSVGHSPCG